MPVMAREVARFQARWNAQGGSVPPIRRALNTITPAARRALSVLTVG
jgi:hypothetical protein